MTKEEIRDLPGYEGLYKISNFGYIVASPKTWLSGRWVNRSLPEKTVSVGFDRKGYCLVGLRKNGKQKSYRLHRLVAAVFISNPENKPQVNHKDANKRNNHVDNLEWATSQENMDHAVENGLMKQPIGENHQMAKLTERDVLFIRTCGMSDYQLAKKYGVCRSVIQQARTGKTWQHIAVPPVHRTRKISQTQTTNTDTK